MSHLNPKNPYLEYLSNDEAKRVNETRFGLTRVLDLILIRVLDRERGESYW